MAENRQHYLVLDPNFPAEFAKLEDRHPQKVGKMKIGIVFCKSGVTDPQEMFASNTTVSNRKIVEDKCSPAFWQFMDNMGKMIELESWTGYKGDMGGTGLAYHDTWNDIEFIFHVAPLLSAEGHRRLIGNDICIVLFLAEGAPSLDLTKISNFGQVPQSWALIQPLTVDGIVRYRLNFFCREALGDFSPLSPAHILLDAKNAKDILLTKMYNSQVKTQYVQPFCRFFRLPRTDTLAEIISKFPQKKQKKFTSTTVFGSSEGLSKLFTN